MDLEDSWESDPIQDLERLNDKEAGLIKINQCLVSMGTS